MSFPNITPSNMLTRDDAINLRLSSIALEELGMSHIIHTKGEKLQFVIGILPGVTVVSSFAFDKNIQSIAVSPTESLLLVFFPNTLGVSASTTLSGVARTGVTIE
jgi:hypothetical protein